ncbi:MAG TPA: universal stress protein [Solirubrobacterales bacterium]|nr:universal stress protein [Solirubrobacterales bacterium]
MEPDQKPVLFAYDGSEQAKNAIRQAGAELRTPRKAVVLAAYEPLGAIPFWGVPAATVPPEWLEQVREQAARTAAEGAELANSVGFEASSSVNDGVRTWQAILDAAEEIDAGMIVLGSHGRGSVGSAVMGSVATAVAHHARRPVLICRPESSG